MTITTTAPAKATRSTVTAKAKETGLNVTNRPDLLALIKERGELKEREAQAKKDEERRKAIDAQLLTVLDEASADALIVAGHKVLKIQKSSNSKIDGPGLSQAHPDIYAEFYIKTPYRFLKGI